MIVHFLHKEIPKYILLFLLISMRSQSYARKYPRNPITEISIQSAQNFVPEFDSMCSIGLTIKFDNGNYRKTRGLNQGTKSWNKFEVKVSHGYFKDGKVQFNRDEVSKTLSRFLTISVSLKRQADFQKSIQIQIPFLEKIFLEYDTTANLVPGYEIPYWIGEQYSSGKIFYSQHLSKKGIIHDLSKNFVSRNDYIIESPDQLIIREKYVILPLSDSIICIKE